MASNRQRFRTWNQNRKKAKLASAIAVATQALADKVTHLEQHRSWLWQTTNSYMNRYRAAEAKLKRLLSTDAGYALGEEAFRVGCEAILQELPNQNILGMSWEQLVENAWANYEPSEEVKELINGKG